MAFAIGSLSRASSSAFCRPSTIDTPRTIERRKIASTLPSDCTSRRSGPSTASGHSSARCSRPSLASALRSAGVGFLLWSSATDTGMIFCSTSRSAAIGATALTCAARRRGVAYAVTTECSPARPCDLSFAPSSCANASPRRLRALGGSSSTSSSTSRLFALMPAPLPSWPAAPPPRRPGPSAPSGIRVARGCRGNSAPPHAPGFGCARCRRLAR